MNVIQNLVSAGKYGTKCPYAMNPTRIVVHNTANDAPAKNEIAYMIGNGNEVSFHFAVDDMEVVQGIPLDRNAWHAGDGGSGTGNRQGIGIEICYSKSGGERFINAEKNAAKFIAQLLKERNWGIDKVAKHQDYSGKYCPHKTLDLGWQRFIDLVRSFMNGTPSAPTQGTEKYGVGTSVCVNKIWTQANGGNLYQGDWKGEITKVISGAEHPYLLNNGTGWTNDDAIDSDPHDPDATSSSATKYDNWLVDPGDTLSKIAEYFECSVDTLARYNNIANPNIIHVGQIIYKPK